MTNDNTPSTAQSSGEHSSPEELRADVERTRENLGETVEALAGKTDIKGRSKQAVGNVTAQARQTFQTAREKAGPVTQQAQAKARELAIKARDAANSPEVQTQARRGGTAVAAGTGVVLLTVWALRRRRAHRLTRWERTAHTAQRTARTAQQTAQRAAEQALEKAAEFGATVRDSDLAAQVQARGEAAAAELAARARQAADAPETKPRAQGAMAAAAALLVLGCMRRSRSARRRDRRE
jgi:hypothetical protein